MRFICLIACIWLMLTASCALGVSVDGYTVKNEKETQIAAGVVCRTFSLIPTNKPAGQSQRLFMLEVDPGQANIFVTCALSDSFVHLSRKRVSEFCTDLAKEGYMVLAAVNGDFFDTGAGGPVGNNMADGRWLCAGEFEEAWSVGFDRAGHMTICQATPLFTFSCSSDDGTEYQIDAVNAIRCDSAGKSSPENVKNARLDNQIVLYTADYAAKTYAADGGVEIRIRTEDALTANGTVCGTITQIHTKDTTTTTKANKVCQGMEIGEGYMVLSFAPEAECPQNLSVGDTITIHSSANPELADCVTVAGGGRPDWGPLLLMNGEKTELSQETEQDQPGFYKRNPRTVAAKKADGTWFFLVVEGNRSGSYGMTLTLLQDVLLDLGADTALNLDGGPSSGLVIKSGKKYKLLTSTTGSSGETRVGSALVICQK